MLIRKLQDNNLYEADATLGTPATPTPETVQGNKTGDTNGDGKKAPEKIEMTSGQLKKRLEDAKTADRKTFLESLGIDSEDALKTLVQAQKAKADSEKSEAQKLADELAKAKTDLEAERKAKTELESLRRIESRDNKLLSLLQKAHDPSEVLATLKATQSAKLDEFLNDNGEFDSAAATAFIADYQAKKPYQFKDERRGSQSNNDGRIPNPDKDRRKEVEKKLSKITQGF